MAVSLLRRLKFRKLSAGSFLSKGSLGRDQRLEWRPDDQILLQKRASL